MSARNLLDSLPEVEARIDGAGSLFLGLDFDGTLAPIRPWPGEAALSDRARGTLRLLGRSPDVRVAIVSGRGLADVERRVGLPELIYAGNHGLEIKGPEVAFVEPTAAGLAARLEALTAQMERLLEDVPGSLVEPKGLTTSVHDRNVAAELLGEVERIVRVVAASDSARFVLTRGHRVWEIRPRVRWRKGEAIGWVLDHVNGPAPRLAFYIGDDETDEDGFAGLPDGVTARVGPAPATLARYRVADVPGVERFLLWLLEKWSERRLR